MKYKGFKWPNNPRICEIGYFKDYKKIILPSLGGYIKQTAKPKRIIKFAGEFFSNNALAHYNALKSIYMSDKAGELYHNDFGNIYCVFTKLKLRLSPEKDLLYYECEFIETDLLDGLCELDNDSKNIYDGRNYKYFVDEYGKYIITDHDMSISLFCTKYNQTVYQCIVLNPAFIKKTIIPGSTKVRIV